MTRRNVATLSWGLYFAFLSLLMLIVGLESAMHFLGPAIDGPFQLYNVLRRINAGQRGGVDFQFFHGLALPYVYYPVYRLIGSGFSASEITRQLLTAFLYPLAAFVFIRAFVRDWTRALAWCAMVMTLSIGFRMTSLLVAVNSLLGVRSLMPLFLPLTLSLPTRRWVRVVSSGVVLGAALSMGTEQGLAAVFALILTTAVVALRAPSRERREYVVDSAIIVAAAAVVLCAILLVIGGVHGMSSALRFNFVTVPRDQYWYFGAPPNVYLSRWSVIPRILFTTRPRMGMSVAAGVVVAVIVARRVWNDAPTGIRRRDFALMCFVLYGLVSCAALLGSYVGVYVEPLQRVLLLTGAVLLDDILPSRDARMGRRERFGVPQSMLMLAGLSSVIMIVMVTGVLTATFVTLPHVIRDHVIRREGPVFAGIWPQTLREGQALVDAHRDAHGNPPTIWSTYAGLLEARNGLFHPSTDYIIHALGPERRAAYLADFERVKPTLVQTVDPLYTQYENWIEVTSWDFYRELLANYEVTGNTPWSIFWLRRPTPIQRSAPFWEASIDPSADSAPLPFVAAPAPGITLVLLEVELTYRARNTLHFLPVVGAMPRYLVATTRALQRDSITIDPYTTTTRFPMLAMTGQSPVLRWTTTGLLPGARLEVTHIRVSRVATSPANMAWVERVIEQQVRRYTQ